MLSFLSKIAMLIIPLINPLPALSDVDDQYNVKQHANLVGPKALKEFDISSLFQGTESLSEPALLAFDQGDLYAYDRENGNIWKLRKDEKPEILFNIDDNIDRYTLKNISAHNGIVITSGMRNIYLYNGKLLKYNNIYGFGYCRIKGDNIFVLCKSGFSILNDVGNHLFHEFDLELNSVKGYCENDLDQKHTNVLKTSLIFVLVNDYIYAINSDTNEIIYHAVNDNICKTETLYASWAEDIINNNKRVIENSLAGRGGGRGRTVVYGIAEHGNSVYILLSGYGKAYIYDADLINTKVKYILPLNGSHTLKALEIMEIDSKQYFLVILKEKEDFIIHAFSE